jgi:hypothetical protein
MTTPIADAAAIADRMHEDTLLDACAAFLCADQVMMDRDASGIVLEDDVSDAVAWDDAFERLTGLRATPAMLATLDDALDPSRPLPDLNSIFRRA